MSKNADFVGRMSGGKRGAPIVEKKRQKSSDIHRLQIAIADAARRSGKQTCQQLNNEFKQIAAKYKYRRNIRNRIIPANVTRNNDDSNDEFQQTIKLESWEGQTAGKKMGNQVFTKSSRSVPTAYLPNICEKTPKNSVTIFMTKNWFAEDQEGYYFPCFGKDAKKQRKFLLDDFDPKLHKRIIEFGAGFRQVQKLFIVDDVLNQLVAQSSSHDIIDSQMINELAELLEIEVDSVKSHYKFFFTDRKQDRNLEIIASPGGGVKTLKVDELTSESTSKISYEKLTHSFRLLFCRRCMTYDCNLHGNIDKPSVDFMVGRALAKERKGAWIDGSLSSKSQKLKQKTDAALSGLSTNDRQLGKVSVAGISKSLRDRDLTPFQMSMLKHSFQMFEGDLEKVSKRLNINNDHALAQECRRQMLSPHGKLCLEIKEKESSRKRKDSGKRYSQTFLNKLAAKTIWPTFEPCKCEEPCNKECPCIEQLFFCTKHCSWGKEGRNFFKGCNCTSGCKSTSCPCFAANRECDPDLCKCCGACTDEAGKPATSQKCRNDNISMRRKVRTFIGISEIPEAGWGLYNKDFIAKGDFIDEYVGEIITQEEAERRGNVYDLINRSYLFNITTEHVVDSKRKGNIMRFANHSSKPNCVCKIMTVNGDTRIGLYALVDIAPESELTFDYGYGNDVKSEDFRKPAANVQWYKKRKVNSVTNDT